MVGWEHNGEEQTEDGWMFNMILQDGARSDNAMTEDGEVHDRYDYFLPENKKITKVTIYYRNFISGFSFNLSDGSNWDIGDVSGYHETVEIADNELIVGFKAK